jgi:hypothetical protein
VLVKALAIERFDLPPPTFGPQQPTAAECRDHEFAFIALNLSEPMAKDTNVEGARGQSAGLVVAHLDELKTPRHLGKAWVNHKFAGRSQRAVGADGEIGEMGDQTRRIGIGGGKRTDDHGIGATQRQDRRGDPFVI